MTTFPTLDPVGLAPGGIFVHLTTSNGEVLIAAPMTALDSAQKISARHLSRALAWLTAHPGSQVRMCAYDGDTGELMTQWELDS